MLRNVLVMASSGIVLFSREFVNGVAQVRTSGGVYLLHVVRVQESVRSVGRPLSLTQLDVWCATLAVWRVYRGDWGVWTVNWLQPRLVGSLVTAMLEFSTKTTGAPVSHLELSNGAVRMT